MTALASCGCTVRYRCGHCWHDTCLTCGGCAAGGVCSCPCETGVAPTEQATGPRFWLGTHHPSWLGARCITGRVRLADPGSLGGGEANAQEALAELRARLVAQHKGAMAASAASSGDAALIHDGERMGLDVAVAELDALALRYANTPPAR